MRHLEELTFSEVSRALRALSATYIRRRRHLGEGAALSGRGKRAAFALFYGPLHYLLVNHIVRSIPGATVTFRTLVDLGCGTGASGAAWGSACSARPSVVGFDRNRWALGEAATTYRAFGLAARMRQGNIASVRLPNEPAAVLAAFTLNEVSESAREALLGQLIARVKRGDTLLIVEPVAGSAASWWNRWRREVESAGGRADEWRFRTELPAIVARLDRAAGLDHREITGRSLWCPAFAGPMNPELASPHLKNPA